MSLKVIRISFSIDELYFVYVIYVHVCISVSVYVYVISNISSGHIKVLDLVWLLSQMCLGVFFWCR